VLPKTSAVVFVEIPEQPSVGFVEQLSAKQLSVVFAEAHTSDHRVLCRALFQYGIPQFLGCPVVAPCVLPLHRVGRG
jgi:hypothetical protein